jgi:hypothetical protein
MNFLRQLVRSLLQPIKQRLRQWTKPGNHTPALDVALDLTRSKSELISAPETTLISALVTAVRRDG